MRSVVNDGSARSVVGGGGGGFSDEAMRTFFAEIKGLVNGAFHALYEEVQQVGDKDATWRSRAMERGLAFMNDRRNEHAIVDSVVESEDACRSLTKQYFGAMHSFVRETLVKKRDLLHVNFVPFGTFIARLYRKLSGVREMKDAYFTTMSYAEKDALLADVLRQVMHASVVWPAGEGGAPSFSAPITPDDSASNVSHHRARPVAASAVGSRVGSVVGNTLRSVVNNETGLSPSTLRSHNAASSEVGSTASRFSRFTPPSVVGSVSAAKLPNKVVMMGGLDPHALPRGPRDEDEASTAASVME